MATDETHYGDAVHRAEDRDDPMAHLHKVMERARKELQESRRRTQRALAEADAALKIGSKLR
jgi:hypothetical protein